MRIYTVHYRRGRAGGDLVLVKEGMSWPAFFLGPVWALWHKMWLATLWLLAGAAVLGAISAVAGFAAAGDSLLSLGAACVVGVFGNDLRRWSLAHRGYTDEGVVMGASEDRAVARFIANAPLIAEGLRP